MNKPSIPKGTRDFGPEQVRKRNYLRDVISASYERFGYEPLETPSMEMMSTLTGKYGAEGEQLLFRILRSGDYLKKADAELLERKDFKALLPALVEKGLRYDLTVPFARYVVMNQQNLPMPFKRYQIQPVWRADRPQKSRYQEFYQCDADVIGSNSLLNELELVQIFDDVYSRFKLPVQLRINNRKILQGVAALIKAAALFGPICTAIDKLDKIGLDGVKGELEKLDLNADQIGTLESILGLEGNNMMKLNEIADRFAGAWIDPSGTDEMRELLGLCAQAEIEHVEIKFDLTLSRGLSYYTGTIFEVVSAEYPIGSISGGGRYDDLTGIFGLEGMSGVGISFGLDRIYDILEQKGWPEEIEQTSTKLLIICMEQEALLKGLEYRKSLQKQGIASEIYPDLNVKTGKKFKYADKKGIPYVAILGSEELEKDLISLKDLKSGEQKQLNIAELIESLR
jgi:histidyl-tRNA synthetase